MVWTTVLQTFVVYVCQLRYIPAPCTIFSMWLDILGSPGAFPIFISFKAPSIFYLSFVFYWSPSGTLINSYHKGESATPRLDLYNQPRKLVVIGGNRVENPYFIYVCCSHYKHSSDTLTRESMSTKQTTQALP